MSLRFKRGFMTPLLSSHFFKVNVGVVHVEYILFPPEDVARRPPVRPRRSSKTSREWVGEVVPCSGLWQE